LGSKKGHKVSEETRRKTGLANRGKKRSEETKRKSSKTWFKKGHRIRIGMKHTSESRKKMSASHKDIPLSTKHRKALRGRTPWNKGKSGHLSEATIRKMSLARKGKSPANKGKKGLYKASKKTRQKLSHALIKAYKENPKFREKLRGRTPWNKGKKGLYKASKKTKKKKSRSMKKAWKVPKYRETMKKFSDARKGHERSEETKRKISIKNLGSKRSEETKGKLRITRSKQVFPRKDTEIEKRLQNLLNVAKIKFETHRMYIERGLMIHGQPDIFIKPNICIFADGDYWHANPKFYKSNSIIIGKKKAKDKWKSDKVITSKLKKQGYRVLRLWGYDINNNLEKCLQKIIKIVKKSKPKS